MEITGSGTNANIVAGNFVGTDLTGEYALPQNYGVLIQDGASYNRVGVDPSGTGAADQGNVISGNGRGISISQFALHSPPDGNVVAGNRIGMDSAGSLLVPNSSGGIEISAASHNTIGGSTAAAGNLITGNGGPGVEVSAYTLTPVTVSGSPGFAVIEAVGDQITANRIFGNTGRAIDLDESGFVQAGASTAVNNAVAPRKGPNNFQNFPIIVTSASGQLGGWLGGSTPNTSFRIDVYASTANQPEGRAKPTTGSDRWT